MTQIGHCVQFFVPGVCDSSGEQIVTQMIHFFLFGVPGVFVSSFGQIVTCIAYCLLLMFQVCS